MSNEIGSGSVQHFTEIARRLEMMEKSINQRIDRLDKDWNTKQAENSLRITKLETLIEGTSDGRSYGMRFKVTILWWGWLIGGHIMTAAIAFVLAKV